MARDLHCRSAWSLVHSGAEPRGSPLGAIFDVRSRFHGGAAATSRPIFGRRRASKSRKPREGRPQVVGNGGLAVRTGSRSKASRLRLPEDGRAGKNAGNGAPSEAASHGRQQRGGRRGAGDCAPAADRGSTPRGGGVPGNRGSPTSSRGDEGWSGETGRTPGLAAGCNKPASRVAEKAVEVVRNHEDGTGLRPWTVGADGQGVRFAGSFPGVDATR